MLYTLYTHSAIFAVWVQQLQQKSLEYAQEYSYMVVWEMKS